VTITGTTETAVPATVSIPGYVNITTPGLIFDVWNSPTGTFSNYPIPGPACFSDAISSAVSSTTKVAASTMPATATIQPSTTDIATFPNYTEFPGASSADLPESIQTFSTGDLSQTRTVPELSEFIVTFTTTTYPTGSVPVLSEIIKTFPGSLYYPSDYPTAVYSSTTTSIAVFPTFTDYPNTPAIPGTVITEDLSWTHSNYYPTWDASASTWIYPSRTATPQATTTSSGEESYSTGKVSDAISKKSQAATFTTEEAHPTTGGEDSTGSSSTEIAGVPSYSVSQSVPFPEEEYPTTTTAAMAVPSSSPCSYYATVTVTEMATTFSTSTRTRTASKSKSTHRGHNENASSTSVKLYRHVDY
jgi:hypothetical protein